MKVNPIIQEQYMFMDANAGDVFCKVFMKDSLREIMGDDSRQEFPWEV